MPCKLPGGAATGYTEGWLRLVWAQSIFFVRIHPVSSAKLESARGFAMTDKTVPLTLEGKANLEEELESLRVQRRAVAERIHNAQELGTSQNDAEYDDAKLEQGMVEGRILEIEDILRRATIIGDGKSNGSGRVVLGSRVRVDQAGKEQHFQIVGGPEADPSKGKISNESPVGSALLGKSVGDTVDVNAPRGVVKMKIVKID